MLAYEFHHCWILYCCVGYAGHVRLEEENVRHADFVMAVQLEELIDDPAHLVLHTSRALCVRFCAISLPESLALVFVMDPIQFLMLDATVVCHTAPTAPPC